MNDLQNLHVYTNDLHSAMNMFEQFPELRTISVTTNKPEIQFRSFCRSLKMKKIVIETNATELSSLNCLFSFYCLVNPTLKIVASKAKLMIQDIAYLISQNAFQEFIIQVNEL